MIEEFFQCVLFPFQVDRAADGDDSASPAGVDSHFDGSLRGSADEAAEAAHPFDAYSFHLLRRCRMSDLLLPLKGNSSNVNT